MQISARAVLLLLFVFITPQSVIAKGPVWKVSKGDNYLYLGGTIHVLSQNDYPLPPQFEVAYTDAETLVFETDINAMSDPVVQMQILQVMMYQDKRSLRDELSADTLKQLDEYLQAREIPANNFDRFTPAGVSMTLSLIELQRLGLGVTSGVDQFFSLRGKNDGKALEGLETIEEQISFINSMNSADGDKMLQSTLRDLGDLSAMWKSMVAAWREGDMLALEALGLDSMERDYPNISKVLLDDRNDRWMQAFPDMLTDNDIEFVLVGSLHMAGEKGLLAQLRAAGYTVNQLD